MGWDRKENVDKQVELVNRAVDNGAKLIILDELSPTVYFPFEQNPEHFKFAETEDDYTITKFKEVSKERSVAVVVPIFERDGGDFYNTAFVIDRGVVVGKYRKTHLPQEPGFNEYYYFKVGNLGFPVFDVEGVKLGVAICHDRHFPEPVRAATVNGAWLVAIPSVASYREIWELEMRAHAVFNTTYVVGLNRVGSEYEGQRNPYFGESLVVSPTGDVVSRAGSKEEILYADVSVEKVAEARIRRPFLKKRLPSYGL